MAKAIHTGEKSGRNQPPNEVRLYTLGVRLISGPVTQAFVKKNPVVSRTIQIRGDQTLADLHQAIFSAFGREQEQMYEFQIGKGPLDPEGQRYVLSGAVGMAVEGGRPPAGRVSETTLASLGLEVGRSFAYWFDFVADWWHQIHVKEVLEQEPRGRYPKVSKRVGANPPTDTGELLRTGDGPQNISGEAAADVSCLIGELHLSKGDYAKAIEAFTRAIDSKPTADAYHGRARAYRALAAQDEDRAHG